MAIGIEDILRVLTGRNIITKQDEALYLARIAEGRRDHSGFDAFLEDVVVNAAQADPERAKLLMGNAFQLIRENPLL